MPNDPEPPLYPMPDETRLANSLRPLVAALLDLARAGRTSGLALPPRLAARLDRPAASGAHASRRFRPRRPVALRCARRRARWSRPSQRWPAISTGGRPIAAPISARASCKTTAGANGSASAARSRATRSPAAFCCSGATPNIPPIRTRRRNSISRSPGMPGGARPSPTGGFARRDNGSIIPPGRPTPCAPKASLCSRPMSGARATSRRNRASA